MRGGDGEEMRAIVGMWQLRRGRARISLGNVDMVMEAWTQKSEWIFFKDKTGTLQFHILGTCENETAQTVG